MKYQRIVFVMALCVSALAFSPVVARAAEPAPKYEVGGPLAGEVLPLYSTQHGEPPGHPGCLEGKGLGGQFPEMDLFPGSVEHYRAYMFKYMPIRSMFDQQSLIKNFPAGDVPGVMPNQKEQYAEPVYRVGRANEANFVNLTNKPVAVVRCKAGDPVFKLNLGTLQPGLYAVRVIGAVEREFLQRHRKPIYVEMTVNDGPAGEKSLYEQRIGYVDEFYSVCELYFHAPAAREYQADLTLGEGSEVDLLVHNITLDSALAGVELRAFKKRSTLFSPEERTFLRAEVKDKPGRAKPPAARTPEERLARDAMLWNAMVPINSQAGFIWGMGKDDPKSNWPRFGAAGKDPADIEKEFGKWVESPAPGPVLMTNAALKLQYTVDDLKAHKPLPGPYPYKDNGLGVFTPPEQGAAAPQNWIPVANAVTHRLRAFEAAIKADATNYHETGQDAYGRDGAVLLARYAYDFPAMDCACAFSAIMVQPGAYGRDLRCRQRDQLSSWMSFYSNDIHLVEAYDKLFDSIQGNVELAKSLHRFIPWIETPEDVVKFFDAYLVQHMAKRKMRYHAYTYPDGAMVCATVLGDRTATDPWMEWQFSRTWSYPMIPTGLQDIIISNMDRSGVEKIGSFFYSQGENAANYGGVVNEKYMLAGGNPKFDLRDSQRYPKIVDSTRFALTGQMAGLWQTPIGDVTGPEKGRGAGFDGWAGMCRAGWRWTKDPGFAYMIKNYYGRTTESDADWTALEKAAAEQPRAPFMMNRSRYFPNWAGILESGIESDDYRFRHAVMLRLGSGSGHSHADTFDLQFFAHGCSMNCDGGQRGGYSQPGDSESRVHNTVEIDGQNYSRHAWMTALSDAAGARYMGADAMPPSPEVSLVRRQVALVDVDAGKPSAAPITPAQLHPTRGRLDPNVITPNAYVFDVFRVAGGKQHTYCFHGYVADGVEAAFDNRHPAPAEAYLKEFPLPEKKFAGAAPDVVQATWQISRQFEKGSMLHMDFEPNGPAKFTRLHLLGHKGDAVYQATGHCNALNYDISHLYVQHKSADNIDSVFPAIIEGYAGEPYIQSVRLLETPGNDSDARRAVAVEVKTLPRPGMVTNHTDICFADGRPEKTRQIVAGATPMQVAGEFAYYSTDVSGFRQASLTGGTLLKTPEVTLQPAQRERTAAVTKVDYLTKRIWLDKPWKLPIAKGRVMEIGLPGHWTTYTLAALDERGTQLTVQGGADFYQSRVIAVDAEKGVVHCVIAKAGEPGLNSGWVATNEDGSKTWRATYMGGGRGAESYPFTLAGAPALKDAAAGGFPSGPVRMEDFGESKVLRLWEYGAGDTVRQSTFVSLRRLEPGVYELTGDVDVQVTLNGKPRKVTADELEKAGGKIIIK